jgi:hypothetical protein
VSNFVSRTLSVSPTIPAPHISNSSHNHRRADIRCIRGSSSIKGLSIKRKWNEIWQKQKSGWKRALLLADSRGWQLGGGGGGDHVTLQSHYLIAELSPTLTHIWPPNHGILRFPWLRNGISLPDTTPPALPRRTGSSHAHRTIEAGDSGLAWPPCSCLSVSLCLSFGYWSIFVWFYCPQ